MRSKWNLSAPAIVATVLGMALANWQATAAAQGVGPYEAKSEFGTYRIAMTPGPASIKLNADVDLTLRITNAATNDAAGIDSISVDAKMPGHNHYLNVHPRLSRLPDGSWLVQGLRLHMPGDWELYFDLTKGLITERTVVHVTL